MHRTYEHLFRSVVPIFPAVFLTVFEMDSFFTTAEDVLPKGNTTQERIVNITGMIDQTAIQLLTKLLQRMVIVVSLVLLVNIQDFSQVFQGSGIGKMEDNLTSADPLSYTTNGSRGDLQILG